MNTTERSAGRALLPTVSGPETRRALLRLLRPHRALVTLASLVLLSAGLAGLAAPALLGRVVDVVVADQPSSAVTPIVVALVLAAVAVALLSALGDMLVAVLGERVLAGLRERVVERALGVPLERVEAAGTGDLVARVSGDVAVVSEAVREAFPELIVSGLTVALTVVGLAVLDWRLALAGLCAAPVQALALRWYLPRSGQRYAAERVAEGVRTQQLVDTVGGARTLRAFGLGLAHADRVATRSRAAVAASLSATATSARFFSRINSAELVGLGAILVVGFFLVRAEAVTVGAATAAALYFHRLFDPIGALLTLLDTAASASAALARLVGVANLPGPPETVTAAEPADASVVARGLGHAYVPGREVLRDVDLAIRPGERVAIVGASGAGKSTLAKLVAGVHEPAAGEVRLGDVPIGRIDPARVRRTVALVTQEVHVFSGPLVDDLRLARPDASEGDLEAALRKVGALGWAASLPDGIRTVVGDGGLRLTATRAQQVALARLVLADPSIVVLDEATAEAGSAGARLLEGAAGAAISGRTALIVAHRLTQARTADCVIVLEDGRMVQTGTHEQLVAAEGPYSDLWRAWTSPRRSTEPGAGSRNR